MASVSPYDQQTALFALIAQDRALERFPGLVGVAGTLKRPSNVGALLGRFSVPSSEAIDDLLSLAGAGGGGIAERQREGQ